MRHSRAMYVYCGYWPGENGMLCNARLSSFALLIPMDVSEKGQHTSTPRIQDEALE